MSPRRGAPRFCAVLMACAALAACAGRGAYPARPSPESLPAGSPLRSRTLGATDAWLRYYLMAGRPDSALRLLDRRSAARPRDELVRRYPESFAPRSGRDGPPLDPGDGDGLN